MSGAGPAQPVFYYDLGSVDCYLLAEQLGTTLGVVPEWEPVLGSDLGWHEPELDRAALEEQARALELQPLRWPGRHPVDTRAAMLAATYAKHVGRAVTFSLAAFRQAFAGGRDLSDTDSVLIAAAACEMHPTAVLKALTLRSVTNGLARAASRAAAAGVTELPAIQIGSEVHSGPGALKAAA